MQSKKLTRRDFLKAAAIGAAGMTLAACQPNQANNQAGNQGGEQTDAVGDQPAAQQKQTVTFSMYGHPNLAEPMVELFNKSQNEVEVQFERSEGQGYWEKLTAAIAGGTAWDAFRTDAPRVIEWGPKNAVLDLSQYIDNDANYPKADYLAGALEAFQVDGKTYGVPAWALTMWMFFNKQIFDAAGEKYPDPSLDWEQYVELARKLTKRDGDRTTVFGANGWTGWTFPLMQLLFSASGKFYYADDMQQMGFNDPANVAVLQSLADMILVDQSMPNPTVSPSSPIGIFSDNVATEGNGDYLPADNNDVMMEKYEYIDATLCPTVNGQRRNVYWPDCLSVNAKTEVPEAAYKWLAWFGRDPEATAIQGKVVFPLYKQAYEDEAIASRWLVAPRPPTMIAQAREHAQNAQILRFHRNFSDLDTIYYNEIGKLWGGEASAEEVANTIAEQGNQAMNK